MQLTMLSAMAGQDFELAARRHAELGLQWLDLKDELWGESVNDLRPETARRVADVAAQNGLRVHCLSSSVGHSNLADGQAAYRARQEAGLERVLRAAEVLQPQVVRLLGATLVPHPPDEAYMPRVEREFGWVFEVYRDLIERVRAAGWVVGIENEAAGCILAAPNDVTRFFELTASDGAAHFIYDVQNMWQMGTFPTLEVYRQLQPLIGGLHLKGGRSEGEATHRGTALRGTALHWAAPLDEATWPVLEIVGAALSDGVAPVACLNPSHGQKPPGYDMWEVAQRDVAFLRREIKEIE